MDEKRILDSVHGYISCPKEVISEIVDTVYFQRLRRIEQTSGRSLFPSAHHDRFVHSLGVYHLSRKISDSIYKRYKDKDGTICDKTLMLSYQLASLLHDVGHTPFSHTFESYFNFSLDAKLKDRLEDKDADFKNDFEEYFKEAAPHEKLSALVVYDRFIEFIEREHEFMGDDNVKGDVAFVMRMIIGCKYKTNFTKDKSLRNVFIDLLHSKVLDADSLDYVRRDTWASGYETANVDVTRLIDAIRIECVNDSYTLCFDIKAIGEINSAMHVKNFQQYNIISHRTVVYEQTLLVKAMENTAYSLIKDVLDDDVRAKAEKNHGIALHKICRYECFDPDFKDNDYKLDMRLPSDDDFVHMMKRNLDDLDVKEWMSRQYSRMPVWKSRETFLSDFSKFKLEVFTDECWLYSEYCREFIAQFLDCKVDDVWIISSKPKNKLMAVEGLKIFINDRIVDYDSLYLTDGLKNINPAFDFKYIFVPKDLNGRKIEDLRSEIKRQYFEFEPHIGN